MVQLSRLLLVTLLVGWRSSHAFNFTFLPWPPSAANTSDLGVGVTDSATPSTLSLFAQTLAVRATQPTTALVVETSTSHTNLTESPVSSTLFENDTEVDGLSVNTTEPRPTTARVFTSTQISVDTESPTVSASTNENFDRLLFTNATHFNTPVVEVEKELSSTSSPIQTYPKQIRFVPIPSSGIKVGVAKDYLRQFSLMIPAFTFTILH